MATCSPTEYVELAKCFSCLNSKQLMEVRLAILCKILQLSNPMAECDVTTLLNDSRCFTCLDNKQMMMVQTQLLCEILAAGGAGGSSCLLCGDVNPTDTPDCTCALYYNRQTGSFWYWDTGTSTWVELIGGP